MAAIFPTKSFLPANTRTFNTNITNSLSTLYNQTPTHRALFIGQRPCFRVLSTALSASESCVLCLQRQCPDTPKAQPLFPNGSPSSAIRQSVALSPRWIGSLGSVKIHSSFLTKAASPTSFRPPMVERPEAFRATNFATLYYKKEPFALQNVKILLSLQQCRNASNLLKGDDCPVIETIHKHSIRI